MGRRRPEHGRSLRSGRLDTGQSDGAADLGAQTVTFDGHLLSDTAMVSDSVAAPVLREAEQPWDVSQRRAQVTLNSIGDAVLCTDEEGSVTFLDPVAEHLTGWPLSEAAGRPFADVCRLVDGLTRLPTPDPTGLAVSQDRAGSLTANCILVRRDGFETAIEDSVAPIRDRFGTVTGAVMVFRDVSLARAAARAVSHRAEHDALTDLPNRTLLGERFMQAIAVARTRHRRLLPHALSSMSIASD